MMSVQAPRTVGPPAPTTVTERAALAYAAEAADHRRQAERRASMLAAEIFGVKVEFDDFIPDDFATRHHMRPNRRVTFAVEGYEFAYSMRERDRARSESLVMLDECPCGRGIRYLTHIRSLADLGYALTQNFDDVKCRDCAES